MFKLTTVLVLSIACASQVIAHGAPPSGAAILHHWEHCFKRDANDSLCILIPRGYPDPYHILGELRRQNITQGQQSVPMELDVDSIDIDIETCESVSALKTGTGGASSSALGFPSGTACDQTSTTSGTYAGADS
ncbi:hypothetical protein ACEPAG_8555 [Sanghuangporus baumii]